MPDIVSILQKQSVRLKSHCAYLFLEDGLCETAQITYGELDRKARAIAQYLQEKNLTGQRILLLYTTGIDFIESFFGCLYAGVVAVPINCPLVNEFEKSKILLSNIAIDAEVAGIFTTTSYLSVVKNCLGSLYYDKRKVLIVDTKKISTKRSIKYKLPPIRDDTIAYLQYTSGSTATPKAAIVRHINLTHSLKYTTKVWCYAKNSITFTWAPHTHVYGLVCGLLVPAYHGSLAIFMPPAVFIKQPILWLRAISKYQVSHSGCPNFGYDICVREITKQELNDINLRNWRVAINGGEQVQYETVVKFAEKFRPCGFELNQFCSAYGMSELTGAIAVSRYEQIPQHFNLSHEGLRRNEVRLIADDMIHRKVVSSGNLLPGIDATVVDPDTSLALPDGRIGEIWLSGKSVISGYWRRKDETEAVFKAKLANSKQSYFRTGDLGFIKEKQLCLVGRLKELIVLHGKKYYSLDIETTIKAAVRPFAAISVLVVFSVLIDNKEEVVLVGELKTELNKTTEDNMISSIRHEVMKQHGIVLHEILLVKESVIPKTASGKLQRRLCQQQYLSNALNIIRKYPQSYSSLLEKDKVTSDQLFFIKLVASVLNIDESKINLYAPLSQYHFDSINIIKLTSLINENYHLSLTPAILFNYSTLSEFYKDYIAKRSAISIKEVMNSSANETKDIAIIGMSAILPGASDVNSFWTNMIERKNVIREIPKDRWDWEESNTIKWGGFIKNIAQFDADFFNISPHEAELLDPQQRHFLQIVWKAIEDAGYTTAALSSQKTGLFVGVFTQDYAELLQKNNLIDAYTTTGTTHSILANRVSYFFNFHGPSEAINTACSSSLVAIHHAVHAIQNGDCELAIAGGVNALITPTAYITASQAAMLSVDGRCKTFDKKADGFVRAEGMGGIVLKPLSKAIKDKDHIYGIIKGTAVNHGGHVNSLTVPNPNAQADVIVTAYRRAQIAIDSIQYIEAHGTGTSLGDPIEVNALKKAFSALADEQGKKQLPYAFCGLGSVKTHIGHLESAAGIASVIKVLLAIKHKTLPGNLNFEELNPYIELDDSPFYILDKTRPWSTQNNQMPRRAGISSFGFGGSNAHILIEEYINDQREEQAIDQYPFLVTLSAKTEAALMQRARDLNEWLVKETELLSLAAISYTLNNGREHFKKRCAFVAYSISELRESLQAFVENNNMPVDRLVDEKLFNNINQEIGTHLPVSEYHNKLATLAAFYIGGNELAWEQLHPSEDKRRCSLPTYPFAEQNYWAPKKKSSMMTAKLPVYLHALLDENISTLEKECFIKNFTGKEFYLKDHQVKGMTVLPGVVIISMAHAAASFAMLGRQLTSIQDISWSKGISIKDQPLSVMVDLYSEEASVLFEIITSNETHAYGRLVFATKEAKQQPKTINVALLKQRLNKKQTAEEIYSIFKSIGLDYGPSFQVIQDVIYAENECMAKIKLPYYLEKDFNQFELHPSLLDGILQTSFTLVKDKNKLYLPISIGEIHLYQSLPMRCHVHVVMVPESEERMFPQFQIQVSDENGNILLTIQDFVLCSPQDDASQLEKGIYHYSPVWMESALLPSIHGNDHSRLSGSILVFENDENVAKQLQAQLINQHVIGVSAGDFKDVDDYIHLFSSLRAKKLFPRNIIFHNNISLLGHINDELIQEQLRQSFYPLFLINQALLKMKSKEYINILCSNQNNSLFTEALSGFAMTLRIENPKINCRIVSSLPIENVMEELSRNELNVCYDQNKLRWVKRYEEMKNLQNGNHKQMLRKKGIYLITGGVGGVGLLFARYLAKQYQAKLILTGRSELQQVQQAAILEFEQLGAEVMYERMDVSKLHDLERVIKKIKKHFGSLNGVIHAAGVTQDALLQNKNIQQIEKVFAAKIYGTLYLDQVTQSEPLDIFILFSSVTAIFGNPGQIDYAYANCFMDVFSTYREKLRKQNNRSGKTFSINWPLWKDGGLKIDKESLHLLEKTIGILPISTDDGIKSFIDLLKRDESQQIILPGYKNILENSLLNRTTILPVLNDSENNISISDTRELKKQTIQYLKNVLSSVLKMPLEKINSTEPFESYGIDSVMVIKINQLLAEQFGDLPRTLFFEYQTLDSLANYFTENHTSLLAKQLFHAPSAVIKTNRFHKREIADNNAHTLQGNDIAIIGLHGRYPLAADLEMFWENLQSGRDCITEIPSSRFGDQTDSINKYGKYGGFIADIDQFDPLFFNISPREAELMDPQERLFLETVWKTIEDAGYAKENLSGKKVGVYVGVMYGQYELFGAEEALRGKNIATNSMYASIANRVSYYFDFHGPSIALDTMCSSSLTSIHLACLSIHSKECELAIAGGVNLCVHPNKYRLLNHGQYLASDGRCRSFGEEGDGYVPGEGVGAILLKPLQQALLDKDHIYAVIKGSSINHGGKTNGYTVPNPIAQAAVIEDAYKNAHLDPTTVTYIEAHGTGTALGDPIEIVGLSKIFDLKNRDFHYAIGSVKSNIGHCEAAAGIAAITKVILQLKHQTLVPSLHSKLLNSNINWETSAFKVQQELSEWKRPIIYQNGHTKEYPRIAGISSFGAGGSNAHIIIQEGTETDERTSRVIKPCYLLTLSARTEVALKQKIIELEKWLAKQITTSLAESCLEDISYTLNAGRSHFEKRCAIVASSLVELQGMLKQIQDDQIVSNACINLQEKEKREPPLVFQKIMKQFLEEAARISCQSTSEYQDNLLALARFYVDGYDPDWQLLHQGELKIKISLPTYPFAKERYWWSGAELKIMPSEEIRQADTIMNDLIAMVSHELKMNADDLNVQENLNEYGMDSLHYVALADKISKRYHIQLTPAIFYAHNSIRAVNQYLLNAIQEQSLSEHEQRPVLISNECANQPIAIIGIEGMFPQSNDLNEFWEHLIAGHDLISEIPNKRWNWQQNYGDSKQDIRKTNSKWGGFISDIDQFDAEFFNISAREANLMDPQQRLFLQIVWKTIENAGYDPYSFSGQKVGVFTGVEFSEYQVLIANQQKEFHGFIATGNSHSMLANRVSYFLNWQGPSEAINTACSSSLVAIHRAVNALQQGECSLAIAGGVSLILNPDTFVIMSQLGALAPDGRCKTFDKTANGYVKGEGVAAVFLKPLHQAEQDGDHIYGIIKGTAVNHCGKSQSLTAPNFQAQSELLIDVYTKSGIDIETITYIETHGTGTALGDPVEIEGLKSAFKKMTPFPKRQSYCGLSAVKTNVGHLEPASGMAGVMKVLLAMKHEIIPGNLHFNELNPHIHLNDTPFYIIDKTKPWNRLKDEKQNDIPRRAGISSFGFGGTNAHIVIEEAPYHPGDQRNSLEALKASYLITLSAKHESNLKQKIIDLYEWVKKNKSFVNLASLSFTLNTGRTHFNVRCALVVSSLEELLSSLQALLNNQHPADVCYASADRERLLALADSYMKHAPIAWDSLYSNETVRRLSFLPTYPFSKERYWFDIEFKKPLNAQPTNLAARQDVVLNYLREIFSEKLHLSADQISCDETYEVFGVDSVIGLEITNRLEHDFGTLPKTILYEKNRLLDLAIYLESNFSEIVNKLHSQYAKNECLLSAISSDVSSEKTEDLSAINAQEGIAIVGLSATLPMAKDINEFWQNLVAGRDCITEIPKERWNYKDYPIGSGEHEKYYKYGGFIPDIDKFDPLFFNISPSDAALMDPQERLFLQSAWTTLEDAGYTREKIKRTTNNKVGVFAGVTYNYYPMFMAEEWNKGNCVPIDIQTFSVANRVSYFLNINGPSFVIDTACSSSLAAIHLACESILRGECKMAIAGGVNLSLHPTKYHFLGNFNFMSEQGQCASFGEGGNGYVPAEGVGSVLLKPLSLAIKDNDHIYGVIRSSSMNHGGKTSGYTVPNPNAQTDLIKAALIKAHIDPRTISCIEAHGTGTSLGDPIEIRGLQEAFETYTKDKQFCAIGSVKSNIGHLESAAGISQLAKVLMQFSHKKLVPSLHSDTLNPFIDFSKTPFYVQRELSDWQPQAGQLRRAGISSFGAGGTNVHMIVDEYVHDDIDVSIVEQIQGPFIFVLSAMNEERLIEYARHTIEFLTAQHIVNQNEYLDSVCYTTQLNRESMPARLAMVIFNYEELLQKIQLFTKSPNEPHEGIWVNYSSKLNRSRVINHDDINNLEKYIEIAKSWVEGSKINWEKIYENRKPKRVNIPSYPFTKRRCWIKTVENKKDEFLNDWLYCTRWEQKPYLPKASDGKKEAYWLIFSDSDLSLKIAITEKCIYCIPGKQFKKLDESTYCINPMHQDDFNQLFLQLHQDLAGRLEGVIYLTSFSSNTEIIKENSCILLYLFQTLVSHRWQDKVRFFLITQGSQAVSDNDPINIWEHYMWSMTRIFASEHSDYQVHLLDLESKINSSRDEKIIIGEILNSTPAENHVAYRDNIRYVIRFDYYLKNKKIDQADTWMAPESAIITGGLGALGFEVAKWLVTQGTSYLLLTGLSGLPDRSEWDKVQDVYLREKIENLIYLEKANIHVKYIAVNAADKANMQGVIEETEKEWGRAIKGVFHLAGITTDNVPLINMDQSQLQQVLAVKIQGALVLHELFNQADLSCFVLFGSIAAVPHFGMSGLSAYAMANEFLNGLALHRRHLGLPGSSINWVAWAEKGMSFRYRHDAFLDAIGMSAISIAQGIEILKCLLMLHPANIIVCKISWEKFLEVNTSCRKLDFFAHFNSHIKEKVDSKKIALQLNPKEILTIIVKTFSTVLDLKADEIVLDTPFQNYGMDSILGINFTKELGKDLPDLVSPMDLYRYPTIKKLHEYIIGNDSSSKNYTDEERLSQEIDNLNDEEVCELIEQELKGLETVYE